jgi:hypothetical protein
MNTKPEAIRLCQKTKQEKQASFIHYHKIQERWESGWRGKSHKPWKKNFKITT